MSTKDYKKLKIAFQDDPETLRALEAEEQMEMMKSLAGGGQNAFLESLKGVFKGDDGYTPVKGKDYFTDEDFKSFKEELLKGATPKIFKDYFTKDQIQGIISDIHDGLKEAVTPVKGKDYRDGEDGEPGKDADPDEIIKEVLKQIPQVKELEAEELAGKLNKLNGKIESTAIKGLPTVEEIVSVIKKGKMLELRDIKGARLDMSDQRWHGGGISNITGLIQAGTNVTITGTGISSDPYIINSTGGGGGSPGGVQYDVQLNDGAGGFAGSNDLNFQGGYLTINGDSGYGQLQWLNSPASAGYGGAGINGTATPIIVGALNGDLSIWSSQAMNFSTDTGTTLMFQINTDGTILIPNLGGSGTQMVTTDNTGLLSKQAIPVMPTFPSTTNEILLSNGGGDPIAYTGLTLTNTSRDQFNGTQLIAFSNDSDAIQIRNHTLNFGASISAVNVTADRIQTLQDANGIIALTSQLLTLQTNNTPNGSQTLLNLFAGTNITLTDNGSGKITIDAGGGGSSDITIGTTTVTGGTNTRILFNNAGVVGEYVISGTGNVAMTTSPVFTTPNIGSATGSVSGNAGTATALQNARTIGGVSFDGTANITVSTATAGFTVSGGNLVLGTNSITLTGSIGATGARVTKGWFTDLQVTNAIAGSITGNAATATALATGRTIAITGDLTYTSPSFDGSGNVTAAGTLATVNTNTGSWGTATQSAQFTVNGKGLITAAANVTITPAVGSITGLGTGIATWLASPSSANLLSAQTDKTGTGLLVFGTSPTLTTAVLGSSTATTQTQGDNSTKVATTAYVDLAVLGQNFKEAARVATTANLVGTYLSGVFTYTATGVDTIDGVTLALNDRVLLKNQTDNTQNGIYKVTTAGAVGVAGVLTRSTDANASNQFKTGDSIFITAGTTQTSTTWAYTGADSPAIGTDPITYAQVAGQGAFSAGNGISITGVSIAIDTSVTVDKTTAQTLTNKTLTTPVINGLPTGTGIATANTASTLVARDGSGNFSAGTISAALTGNASTATALASARTLWGQSFDGTGNVTGSLTLVGDITGGASSMAIQAGTGASRTLTLKTTTSGSVAQTNLTLNADQSSTFSGLVALGANSLTMTGSLAATGARVTKGWFTDLESTNMPTVGGVAILTSLTAPQFTTIELGNASDTTLSRASAGVLAVEGVNVLLNGGALGTPSSGTGTNITGIPAANILAGTFGTGSYTIDTRLTVPQILNVDNAVTATSNAVTFTRANRNNVVTNNSAATLTITLSTTSATAGDMLLVQILDSSGVTQTITWVNTEDSTVIAPTTSNGSTSLPLTVGFKWNAQTSKWRCIAKA